MPSSSPAATLIIHNGGYCSLLASLIAESEADRTEPAGRGRGLIYAWIPPVGSGLFADEPPYVDGAISMRNRAEMAARQAKLFGFRDVFCEDGPGRGQRSSVSALLLRALELASAHRCGRVVWPISVGGELESIRRVTEQAALVTDLWALEQDPQGSGGFGGVRVSTPFADLGSVELDRLAHDLDAPLEACWKSAIPVAHRDSLPAEA